jgi:glycosyltransferase involved in cell wall biosynthesis
MSTANICHISTFSPTQCGIATYTEQLIHHLSGARAFKVRMAYSDEEPRAEFDCTVAIGIPSTYDAAVTVVNRSTVEVVSLQHEFGIYGGTDGEYVAHLLEGIEKPIVTTLHTIPADTQHGRGRIIEKIAKKCRAVVVLTEESKELLASRFDVPHAMIRVIRHGIPSVAFIYPEASKLRSDICASVVFVSAGHVRPTKGYAIALRALARYRQLDPNFKYVIVGTTQPQFHMMHAYPSHLKRLIERLDLGNNVLWIDEYLDLDDLLRYIMAADMGLVTYTELEQNSSGILPFMLGCGRPVVATAFAYARSIAKRVPGILLADMNDAEDVFRRIIQLTQDRDRMRSMMHANYSATRSWVWQNAAIHYRNVFEEVLNGA